MLEDKTIIITGVGSGLGREVACRCAQDGANIVIGARTEAQLEQVAAEADPSGQRVAVVPTDITNAEACANIVAQAEKRFGKIDGFVQVAAFEYAMGGLYDSKFEDWHKSFDTNVIAALQLLREVATAMKKNSAGSVVLIGSQSMYQPAISQMGYAASKGALLSSMYYLAQELGADGIRVNTVVPSWMWGPPVEMFVKMEAKQRGVEREEVVAGITKNIPLGEITADDDVAQAVAFFLSDRARMITGQSLMVNGGELMR